MKFTAKQIIFNKLSWIWWLIWFFFNLITGSPFKIGPSFEQTLKLFNDRLPNLVKITDCSGEEVRKENV